MALASNTTGPGKDPPENAPPLAVFEWFAERGVLAYQIDADERPVFYPRACAPAGRRGPLQWRQSAGLGRVYATTVQYERDDSPLGVVLVELDEGFRMMSRIEGMDPREVRIGMRVRVAFRGRGEDHAPMILFEPIGEDNDA